MTATEPPAHAQDLASFLDACPTPYHAVAEVERRLRGAGFERFDEREAWHPTPGQRFYVKRGGGSLVACQVGSARPADAGFVLLGAHTDSPNLRLKPNPEIEQAGYRQLGVEVYGGVLWHSWLDRDLSIAGRVVLDSGTTRLVRLSGAPCTIPSLAIHLDRTVNDAGLKINPEEHLRPLVAALSGEGPRVIDWVLAELRARGETELGPENIVASDLMLFDVQGARFGGPGGELLHSARLDNLASCHAATTALLQARPRPATQGIALFDHEEIGSVSAHGADSLFLRSVLERIDPAPHRALARSLLVSIDMTHGVHPSHAARHDEHHRPLLGAGPVLKLNADQRYASNAPAQAVFLLACRAAGFEAQHFVSRNDVPCGSTIGPLAAAQLGMRTVDVGNPMLSMHSCRETCDARDVRPLIDALGVLLSEADLPDPAL